MSTAETLNPETFTPQPYPLYAWVSTPTVYGSEDGEISEIQWQRSRLLVVGWGTYGGHIEPMVWYGNGFTSVPLNCITQDYYDAPYLDDIDWEEIRDWFGQAAILIDIGIGEPGASGYEAREQSWEKTTRLVVASKKAAVSRETATVS
jgi:hypothetical protein